MSGFDVQMRSQQMVNQSQQFYDAQRYESMQQMGQSLMQGPGIVQDMMLRQQDAKMRLALQQQEFQGNALKLQAMMAIDQADVSREQARAAKLQNDAMELDMRMRMQASQQQEALGKKQSFADILRAAGGVRGAAAAGIGVNLEKGEFEPMDAEQMRAVQAQFQGDDERLQAAEDRRRMEFEYKALMEQGDIDQAGAVLRKYRGDTGSPAPSPRSQPAAAPMSDEKMRTLTAKIGKVLRSQEAAPFAASWMAKNSKLLLEQKRRAARQKGWSQAAIDAMTEEEAVQSFVDLLGRHESPEAAALFRYMREDGAFDGWGGDQ